MIELASPSVAPACPSGEARPREVAYPERTGSAVFVVLAVIIFVGGLVRVYPLAARSFWFDEAFTWRLIDYPWLEMLERAKQDHSPPFYYFVLKGWSEAFGTSPVALRSLGVLFGLLTILGAYVLCLGAFGRSWSRAAEPGHDGSLVRRAQWIGLLAAALVALSPMQIRYATEVRMYALAAFLAVFSGWALLRALRDGAGWRAWLLYAVLAILLAYTHYYGLFTLAGEAVFAACFLLARARRNRQDVFRLPETWHALSAAAVIFVAWLPWLGSFLQQQQQVRESFWTVPVSAWQLAEVCHRMFGVSDFTPFPGHETLLAFALPSVAGVCLLAFKAGAGEWLVLCSALSPFALCLVASALGTHTVTARYFIMAQPFWIVALAALVCPIPYVLERSVAATAVLAVFVLFAVETGEAMYFPERPGARAAAEFLARERQPGEPVIVSSPLYYLPLIYHGKKSAGFYMYNDGQPFLRYHGTAVLRPEESITQERLEASACKRVWVVNMVSQYWGSRMVPMPARWVEKNTRGFADLFGIGEFQVAEYMSGEKRE